MSGHASKGEQTVSNTASLFIESHCTSGREDRLKRPYGEIGRHEGLIFKY